MSEKLDSRSLEQLMAEADELVGQFDSEILKDMQEDQRIQFEKNAQNLEKIKSKIQGTIGKKDEPKSNSGADGMHEAIQDIVKAMQNFQKNLL